VPFFIRRKVFLDKIGKLVLKTSSGSAALVSVFKGWGYKVFVVRVEYVMDSLRCSALALIFMAAF
jgi:hypothetical protein